MLQRLLACALLSCSWAAAEQPNFILLFADDLGYGDLSSFGSARHRTERLDRMAAEGVKLTSFYVPMPFCAPSRAAILTGRYPFRNGVVENPSPDAGKNEVHLPLDEVTIAEALKPHGYATAAIGKWHLGHRAPYLPGKQGFDEYFGILYSNDMRPVQLVENDRVVEYPVLQGELTRRYTERAIDFIERNRDQPFFLYLPYAMPHKPLAASERFYTPETPDDLYSDVMRELDWSVGELLDALERLDLDEKTLVIFTSDNGPWYGGETGGLRGMKGLSWDGGIRVPLIARWPGRIPAGRTLAQPAGTVDVMPTLLRAANVDPPASFDGVDLMPLWSGATDAQPHEAILAQRGPDIAVIRSSKWKLHVRSPGPNRRLVADDSDWVDPRAPDGLTILAQHEQARPRQYPGATGGVEPKAMMLFDLESDPAERVDVADRHPDVVARLRAFYERMHAQTVPLEPTKREHEGLRWIEGGDLRYDRVIQPVKP